MRLTRTWLMIVVTAMSFCATAAQAVEPQLNDIVPNGFQRGTEVDVQFTGGGCRCRSGLPGDWFRGEACCGLVITQ